MEHMIPHHTCSYYCAGDVHALRLLSTGTAQTAMDGERVFYAEYDIPLMIVDCIAAREAETQAWYAELTAVHRQAHTFDGRLTDILPVTAYHGYLLLVRETGAPYPPHVEFVLS